MIQGETGATLAEIGGGYGEIIKLWYKNDRHEEIYRIVCVCGDGRNGVRLDEFSAVELFVNEWIMKKIGFVLLVIGALVGGCDAGKGQLEPEALFVVRPGERLSVEQQGERLKYGRMLRLEVEADTTRVPTVDGVPEAYRAYAEAYSRMLNRYLVRLDSADCQQALAWVRDNAVENAVLGACVELEDGKYALTLSREDAVRIGIPAERYDGVAADVAAVNAQIASGAVDVAELAN